MSLTVESSVGAEMSQLSMCRQSYYENTYWYWIQLIQCLHGKCEEIYKNTTEVKCKYTTSGHFLP